MTPLDKVFEQVADGDQAALMRAYHFLADHGLFVLLEQEATAANILPKVFDLPEGKVILAFDTEERLSAFGPGGADYAALPGRLIAQQLAGTDMLLGLNFGSGASSEVLLPTTVLDWLTKALEAAPVAGRPIPFIRHRICQQDFNSLSSHWSTNWAAISLQGFWLVSVTRVPLMQALPISDWVGGICLRLSMLLLMQNLQLPARFLKS